jgi:glycerol-3-phosphate dehydrogenase (NAD(P)+)
MAEQATSIQRIGVIGSGSWGTALAFIASWHEKADMPPVHWWVRREDTRRHLIQTGHNPHYIKGLSLNMDRLKPSSDLQAVIDASDVLILAVPSAHLDAVLHPGLTGLQDKVFLSAVKGLVTSEHHVPARYLHKVLGVPYGQIGLISGPSHAEEVARTQHTYLTLAALHEEMARALAQQLSNQWLHIQCTNDVFGIELAAAMKNIYAVAAGVAHGLSLGDNFISVLVSNALSETNRFLDAVNDTPRDVSKSPYLGDLLVTAYSPHSRNRTLGNMVGKGYSIKGALMEMGMVAEGVRSSLGIHTINQKFGVSMPIADAVYRILHEEVSPAIEMQILTQRIH